MYVACSRNLNMKDQLKKQHSLVAITMESKIAIEKLLELSYEILLEILARNDLHGSRIIEDIFG